MVRGCGWHEAGRRRTGLEGQGRLPGGSHICAGSSKMSRTYSFEKRRKEIPSRRRGSMKK